MRRFGDLAGTMLSYFRIGTVRLKDSSGTLIVRNAGDSSNAAVEASAIKLTTGAGTGKVLVSDADGDASWGSAEGITPADAEYITSASNVSLGAEVVVPGLAGSADKLGVGAGGIGEEFDTTTTGLTWTPSTPATVDSDTTRPSHLYVYSSDGTERRGLRDWSPAGAFDARIKLTLSDEEGNNGAAGLIIETADGSSRLMLQTYGDNANKRRAIAAYTYAASTYTMRGGIWYIESQTVYLRIVRDASNNVSFFWSADGYGWDRIAYQAFTLTVAKIGIRSADASHHLYVDFLRTTV